MESETEKAEGTARAKVLAILTFLLSSWQLLFFIEAGARIVNVTPPLYELLILGSLIPVPLYVIAGVTMWQMRPQQWRRIATLLVVALVTNFLLLILILGTDVGEAYRDIDQGLLSPIVALVGGFLILLGSFSQKRLFELGRSDTGDRTPDYILYVAVAVGVIALPIVSLVILDFVFGN